ncbi:MAG: hypothetical protein ABH950_08410 [Candidatus Altiarchaeota archaeon]
MDAWPRIRIGVFSLPFIFIILPSSALAQFSEAPSSAACFLTLGLFVLLPAILLLSAMFFGYKFTTKESFSDEGIQSKNRMLYCLMGLVVILMAYFLADFTLSSKIPLGECVGVAQMEAGEKIGGPRRSETSPVEAEFQSPEIILFRGWNLIGIPLLLNDSNMSVVLGDVNFSVVYSFRPELCNQKENIDLCWEVHLKNGSGNLRDFELDRGYWIHVLENSSFSLNGRIPDPKRNVSLLAGWNLLSYLGEKPASFDKAFEGLVFSSVYGWDPVFALEEPYHNGWLVHTYTEYAQTRPPLPPAFSYGQEIQGPLHYMTKTKPTQGYYLYSPLNQEWTYDTGIDPQKYNVTTTTK